ncbi:MAG: response regulator [Planctomyces sp.]|nr:response regulator [Planctomyces sp.]
MNYRVLLCDDEPHVLLPLSLKFRKSGFEVILAEHGGVAWTKILESIPDVVITDCNMPHMTGLQLIEKIRGTPQTMHLPAILLTAKGYEMDEADLQERLGVSALVVKPFSPKEVVQTAIRLLNLSGLDSVEINDRTNCIRPE